MNTITKRRCKAKVEGDKGIKIKEQKRKTEDEGEEEDERRR
jgi:hypothetical protein